MMSETIISLPSASDENVERVAKHKNTNSSGSASERKTLRTLQLSADGKLIGSKPRQSPLKKGSSKITPFRKPLTIYADKKPSPTETGVQTDKHDVVETAAQTDVSGAAGVGRGGGADLHNDSGVFPGDADQEAYDLMVRDEVPESYWRDLAEERRLSLAEALSENEMLHQSMDELKEENHNLSLLASQAEYFANLLNNVLNDSKCEDKDKEDTSQSTDDGNTETADAIDNETDSETQEKSNNGSDEEQTGSKEDEAR